MHDIRLIREAPAAFDAALARRGLVPDVVRASLLAMDESAPRQDHGRRNRRRRPERRLQGCAGAAKARGDEAEFNRLRTLVADKKAEGVPPGRRSRSRGRAASKDGPLP